MKWDGKSSVQCTTCKKIWREDKVPLGFYIKKRPLLRGGFSVHVQQPCKYCITRKNKIRYAAKVEALKFYLLTISITAQASVIFTQIHMAQSQHSIISFAFCSCFA